MLRFARETRLSETSFLQTPTEDGADYRNRIWMVRGEVPFAGHPTLGVAVAVALARGDRTTRYVQQTPAGLQPIDVEVLDDRTARASMLQEPATFGPELDVGEVFGALGLDATIADPELPPQVVNTGAFQVLVPVPRGALDEMHPDFDRSRAIIDEHDALTIYVAAIDGEDARARAVYVDASGLGEDPATGSAAGPLMAYVHQRRGTERLRVEQGVEMGRPSEIALQIVIENGTLASAEIGGGAVVVSEGQLHA